MGLPSRIPLPFRKYWSKGGKGGAQIDWGRDGDFDRCRILINQAIVKGGGTPLPDHVVSGMCEELHEANTGAPPGHAPGESKPKR